MRSIRIDALMTRAFSVRRRSAHSMRSTT